MPSLLLFCSRWFLMTKQHRRRQRSTGAAAPPRPLPVSTRTVTASAAAAAAQVRTLPTQQATPDEGASLPVKRDVLDASLAALLCQIQEEVRTEMASSSQVAQVVERNSLTLTSMPANGVDSRMPALLCVHPLAGRWLAALRGL